MIWHGRSSKCGYSAPRSRHVPECNEFAYQPIPLLVLVTCAARPNLQFVPVDVFSAGNVEAERVKEFDAAASKPPLLVGSSRTVFDSDLGTIGLRGGGQTFARV